MPPNSRYETFDETNFAHLADYIIRSIDSVIKFVVLLSIRRMCLPPNKQTMGNFYRTAGVAPRWERRTFRKNRKKRCALCASTVKCRRLFHIEMCWVAYCAAATSISNNSDYTAYTCDVAASSSCCHVVTFSANKQIWNTHISAIKCWLQRPHHSELCGRNMINSGSEHL